MGSYRILFKPTIEKDFQNIAPSLVLRVMKRIEFLANNPFPPQSTKLSSAEKLYRIRVSDYRIVYEVDVKGRQVIIHYVRRRSNVYRRIP